MKTPQLLKPGDTIGILAPARKINPADVEFAATEISSWGVKVVVGKNIHSNRHGYLSGSDEERLADFQNMLDDDSIDAIICARGGYGSTRIVDALDLTRLETKPKWIAGFSDITAILLKLLKHDIASIHGTMPILFSKADSGSSVESLRKLLFEGTCVIEMSSSAYSRGGISNGITIGGNLSLLVDALGTPSEPDTRDKILIIEEIDEYRYKIDRMFTQLRRAGKLESLRGLVIGHMTDIKDTSLSFGQSVEEIILNHVKHSSFPVAFNFPSGHENPNYAWIHGGMATFAVSDRGVSLSYNDLT